MNKTRVLFLCTHNSALRSPRGSYATSPGTGSRLTVRARRLRTSVRLLRGRWLRSG